VTDPALVAKKLAVIEGCVSDLRRLARPELLGADVREERFVQHTLQIAIQAALDVASHIVSDERLGEPETNRQVFDLLVRGGWVTTEQAAVLKQMTAFRNILVHGYQAVDLRIVREILERRLDDLLAFAAAVRGRI
jgi:uncharacterized protein YutE (UPF0331/DUF86 family)